MSSLRWRTVAMFLGTVVLSAAIAIGIATLIWKEGKGIADVLVAHDDQVRTTQSIEFEDVPGARVVVRVPDGEESIILARFSATSDCIRDAGPTFVGCGVRVLIGGEEGHPRGDISFDTTGSEGTDDLREAHAIERSLGPVGPGSYVVQVQWRTGDAAAPFALHGWHLTVERIRTSN